MEVRDSMEREPESPAAGQPGSAGAGKRVSIDRLEFNHQWVQQAEEQQAEETAALYEKAARQWMQPDGPEKEEEVDTEELEAMSRQLKLRQKCQDIAALMMAVELENKEDQ